MRKDRMRGGFLALPFSLMLIPGFQALQARPAQSLDKGKIEQLEKFSARTFHQILNQFRKENKKDTLAWHPILNEAARNHCLWMSQNTFSHKEKAGTPGFTGVDPSDRVQKVRGEALSSYRIGENIVFFTFSDPRYLTPDDADDLAREAFELWESSPGHRSNMLEDMYRYHGISFHIDEHGSVYGTSVFSAALPPLAGKPHIFQDSETSIPQAQNTQLVTPEPESPASQVLSAPVAADTRLLDKYVEKKLKEFLRRSVGSSLHTVLNEAATNHLAYVLTHETETSEEERNARNFSGLTPHHRLKKILGVRGAFLGKPEWTVDRAFYRRLSVLTEENVQTLLNELQESIRLFLEETGKGNVGYAVRVQRKKEDYRVGVVIMHTRHRL